MYKFGIFIFYFASALFVSEGISLIFKQKGFDPIAYFFYEDNNQDIWIIDLTGIPYWVSFVLGLFFILFPLWIYIKDRFDFD